MEEYNSRSSSGSESPATSSTSGTSSSVDRPAVSTVSHDTSADSASSSASTASSSASMALSSVSTAPLPSSQQSASTASSTTIEQVENKSGDQMGRKREGERTMPDSVRGAKEAKVAEKEIMPENATLKFTDAEVSSKEALNVSTTGQVYHMKNNRSIEMNPNKVYIYKSTAFKICGEFGVGTNAIVLKLASETTSNIAMKHTSYEDSHQGLIKEFYILTHLASVDRDCEYFVKLLGYRHPSNITNELSLFLQPLTCSLEKYLTDELAPRIPHFHIIRYVLKNIISAVAFLRKNRIIHTNINPDNLMILQTDTKDGSIFSIKLINFDRALIIKGSNALDLTGVSIDDYSAPEVVFKSGKYPSNSNIELYSVGLIAWRLLTGENIMKSETIETRLMNMREVLGPIPTKFEEFGDCKNYFQQSGDSLELKQSLYAAHQDYTEARNQKKIPTTINKLEEYKPKFLGKDGAERKLRSFEKKDLANLIKFISECLKWEPSQRVKLAKADDGQKFINAETITYDPNYKKLAEQVLDGESNVKLFNQCLFNGQITSSETDKFYKTPKGPRSSKTD